MVNLSPATREKVLIAKKSIQYIVGKTTYTYDQVLQLVENVLNEVLDTTVQDLKEWVDINVPKRTGQLRHLLKQWITGSNIYKGVLRLVIGTNLDYAKDVAEMTTSQVRHSGEKGYVYYPNIFGIRGPVILNDPQAIGFFWDEILKYAKERLAIRLEQAKAKYLTQGRVAHLIRSSLNVK